MLFIYWLSLVAVRGSYCLVAVRRLLAEVASLVAEHGFQGLWALAVAALGWWA